VGGGGLRSPTVPPTRFLKKKAKQTHPCPSPPGAGSRLASATQMPFSSAVPPTHTHTKTSPFAPGTCWCKISPRRRAPPPAGQRTHIPLALGGYVAAVHARALVRPVQGTWTQRAARSRSRSRPVPTYQCPHASVYYSLLPQLAARSSQRPMNASRPRSKLRSVAVAGRGGAAGRNNRRSTLLHA
jgi:hypothetical protein